MFAEQVDELIINYRQNIARKEFLESYIPKLEREIQKKRMTIVEETVSITAQATGMPHGSGTSDPTGKLGTQIADGYTTDEIKELEAELAARKDEHSRKEYEISVVNSLFKCLTEKELFVVQNKLIWGLSWKELRFSYNKRFETLYTESNLKCIKKAALHRMYDTAR